MREVLETWAKVALDNGAANFAAAIAAGTAQGSWQPAIYATPPVAVDYPTIGGLVVTADERLAQRIAVAAASFADPHNNERAIAVFNDGVIEPKDWKLLAVYTGIASPGVAAPGE